MVQPNIIAMTEDFQNSTFIYCNNGWQVKTVSDLVAKVSLVPKRTPSPSLLSFLPVEIRLFFEEVLSQGKKSDEIMQAKGIPFWAQLTIPNPLIVSFMWKVTKKGCNRPIRCWVENLGFGQAMESASI